MKRHFQLIFLFLTAIPAVAQTSAEKDEQEIKDLIIDSFQEIFSENRQDKLSTYYTEDFILLEDGEVWDIEIIKNYMAKAAERNRSRIRINSFDFIKIQISGDMGWIAYHNKAVFEADGKKLGEMNWLESAVAIRKEDGWKLQMLHSTVVKKEE